MRIWSEPTTKDAFYLGFISTVIEFFFFIGAITWYILKGSNLILVFGLENFVDWFSSVVVLWRFFVPGELTKEREAMLQRRELRASVAISLTIIIMGVSVIASSSFELAGGEDENVDMELVIYILSAISVCIFTVLMFFKFRYSFVLDSDSLHKDGLCSLLGVVLSSALLINALILDVNPHLWWLDPSVALICGLVALIYGVHSVFVAWWKDGVPVCSMSWWLMSRGDGEDSDSDGSDKGDDNDKGDENSVRSTTNLSKEVV